MIAAQEAIRAWVNSNDTLVGEGNPLANGAYTLEQRSPASGCYLVLARLGGADGIVAEQDGSLCTATVAAMVFGGTSDTAERAAAAYATAVELLQGSPEPCGDTHVHVLVSDKLSGPRFMPAPADTGEQYAFQVTADFVLAEM